MRVLLFAVLTACAGQTTSSARLGTAEVRWSLEGSFDPRACTAHDAASAVVDVYRDDALVTTVSSYCTEFGASVTLAEGAYTSAVTLVDAHRAPVSSTVTVPFTVRIGDGTPVEVDFRNDAFRSE